MIVRRGRLAAGVMAQGGDDAGSAGEPQDGDGQVAQGGHDLWPAGGADLGAVLIEVQVAHPVEPVLDAPVAADDGGELGRAGLGHGQRGDGVAGFAGPLAFDFAAAGDLDGLGGAGEGQAPGYRGDLEGAPLGAAVAAFPLV